MVFRWKDRVRKKESCEKWCDDCYSHLHLLSVIFAPTLSSTFQNPVSQPFCYCLKLAYQLSYEVFFNIWSLWLSFREFLSKTDSIDVESIFQWRGRKFSYRNIMGINCLVERLNVAVFNRLTIRHEENVRTKDHSQKLSMWINLFRTYWRFRHFPLASRKKHERNGHSNRNVI